MKFSSSDFYSTEKENSSPAFKEETFNNFVPEETNQLEDFLADEEEAQLKYTGEYKSKFSCDCFSSLSKNFDSRKTKGNVQNIILFVFVFLAVASSMTAIVFTFMQITNREQTDQSTLENTYNTPSACEGIQYHPLRFRVFPDSEFLQCAWPTNNSVARILLSVAGLIIPIICILAIRKNKKWLMWIFGFFCLVIAGVYFYIMAIDSDAVRKSSSFCSSGLSGVNFTPKHQIECGYMPFIAVCLIDTFAFVFWFVLVFLSIRHARKNMDRRASIFQAEI